MLSNFASNNSLPFSIKAYEIGEQVGYKVTPGEKEGYEHCCSGAESCMRALKDKELIDFDIRRNTGFIVKNIKTYFDDEESYEWMKTVMNPITHDGEHEYEYKLDEVIKFDERTLQEDLVKIKINEISKQVTKETETQNTISTETDNRLMMLESVRFKSSARLDRLEDWKSKTESELVMLALKIDALENSNLAEEKVEIETTKEQEELSKSRDLVWTMMYLGRFFRTGVRRDNNTIVKKNEWQEFSRISGAINGGVEFELRIDSFKHKDMYVAEMSGAIVVVLSARDYPKYFVSMNQEETELFSQCSEMFNEFDLNDFKFNSDAYCKTSHWKIKRDQKLAASLPECSECNRSFDELKGCGEIEFGIPIQVHHKSSGSYSRIFRENLEDLVVLCKECHEKKHPDKKEQNANNDN